MTDLSSFIAVGISVCEELDVASILAASGEDKEAQQKAIATAALDAVRSEYKALEEALFADASKRSSSFVQPWMKTPALA